MFSVGDIVCYPMNGVGRIEIIENNTVGGETNEYYRLRFETGRLTVLVPVKNADNVGLRHLSSPEMCEKVEQFLINGDCSPESSNWNQRYRDNYEKLKSGDILTVADVVKSLHKREKSKGLSAGERKMYLTAKQVLMTELTASTGRPIEEFMSALDSSC